MTQWHAHNVQVAQLRYMLRHGMDELIAEVFRRREAIDAKKPAESVSAGSCSTTEPCSCSNV